MHENQGPVWGGVCVGVCAILMSAGVVAEEARESMPTSAEVAERVPNPLLRIPFMKTPPKIDGQLDPREWEDAACYTGFWQDYSFNNFLYLAIEEKQAQFYMAYDKDNFYFAHKSPVFPKGAWLKCRGKYKDVDGHPDYGLLLDDHVEFQILPSSTTAPHATFFKWMQNPINTYSDFMRTENDLEYGFESSLVMEGKWDENWWVTEMKFPLASMRVAEYAGNDAKGNPVLPLPIRDGTIWRHWGSRAIGGVGGWSRLFSATTPGGWGINSMRMIFDSKGVSAQVETLGPVMRDQVNLHIQLKNYGERSETVKVGFYIENDSELILANEEEGFVDLLPGEVKNIRIKKGKIGVTPKGDALWVDIRTLSGMAVYRSILTPFHHVDGITGFKEHFIDGMKFSRAPRKPFEYRFQYYASTNAVFVTVDTDVYGVSEAVKGATEAKVRLVTDNGDEVQSMTFALEKPYEHPDAKTFGGRVGHGVMRFAKLKPGMYKTVCLLYDANKKIVSDQESGTFEQKSFPWENSQEGLEDTVWEPYIPMVWNATNKTAATLMHDITVGSGGLPAQIAFKGKNPNFGPQFRAPMRFEATVKDKRFSYEPAGEMKRTLDRKSEMAFEGSGKTGPVTMRSRVQYDCDGFMTYDLWYKTGKEPVDSLELVMDFNGKPIDLFGFQGGRMFQRNNGKILQRKDKIIWNSKDDMQSRELFYGNFVPLIMMGSGDRAFTWTCSTDQGMNLIKDKPAAQIERAESGELTLRIFFVNEPGPVAEEKHVQFYLTCNPNKPKSKNHRTLNWKYEGVGGGPTLADGSTSYSIHLNHEEDYAKFIPKPIVPRSYTTANMVCFDMPGLRELCYAGEWLGQTDFQPNPNLRGESPVHPITGRANDTLLLNTDVGWSWGPSMAECALYWRSRQVRLGGQQGYWWDSPFFGEEDLDVVIGNAYYLPKGKYHAGGSKQYAFHYYYPRQMLKRLMRVFAVAGRVPEGFTKGIQSTSATYGGIQAALAEFFLRDEINWEGAASYTGGSPHMEYWSLDEVRFCANNYTGLNGYFMHDVSYRDGYHAGSLAVPRAGANPILDRSVLGNALLHDLGSALGRHANKYPYHKIVKALEEFGYYEDNDTTEFIPYWRSRHLWRIGLDAGKIAASEFADEGEKEQLEVLKNVQCTIYKNHKTGKAMLVLANYGPTPVEKNLVVTDALLGKPAKKCTDVENDEPIGVQKDVKEGKTPLPNTFWPIYIDKYQFRLLVVE